MKCIKNDEVVIRVKDDVAVKMVDSGKWRYAKKSEWKAGGRSYGPRKAHG